jgi:hypothetical protein
MTRWNRSLAIFVASMVASFVALDAGTSDAVTSRHQMPTACMRASSTANLTSSQYNVYNSDSTQELALDCPIGDDISPGLPTAVIAYYCDNNATYNFSFTVCTVNDSGSSVSCGASSASSGTGCTFALPAIPATVYGNRNLRVWIPRYNVTTFQSMFMGYYVNNT